MNKVVSRMLSEKVLPQGNLLTTYSKNGRDICSAILKNADGGRQIIKVNDFNEIYKITNVVNHKRQALVPTPEQAQAYKAMLGIL